MELSERFLAVIDDIRKRTEMSQSQIERRCGMSSVISNVRNGKVEPSLPTITRLLLAFPDYSAEWMLTGRDAMLKMQGELGRVKRENESLLRLNVALQKKLMNGRD